MIQERQTMLHFEFINKDGDMNPLSFVAPEEIIIARTVEEVVPCLQRIQKAVESGLYAAGYLTYEAAPAFDQTFTVNPNNKMPLLWFGLFRHPSELSKDEQTNFFTVSKWDADVSQDEYYRNIDNIKQYIKNGDTYQVNYTIRLHSLLKGDDFSFYKQLAKGQSANYCAYISTDEYSILSASPELFFHLKDQLITTKPMKGTIQRGKTHVEDLANFQWLSDSVKNRSENLMIVDLIRNDLGQIAETGTVKVPHLFSIEKYPTVFQMTSTVTAQLSPKTSIADIFVALFPCGSITGAPKISTMRIINELEDSPREVYCGAIGYITPEMEAIFNVPIRTVVVDKSSGQAVYGVGGGITWDSTAEEEYKEVLTKAMLLERLEPNFQLLESLYLKNGQYFLLNEHIERLKHSAEYFGFSIDIANMGLKLQDYAAKHRNNEEKVRVLLTEEGHISIEGQPLVPTPAVVDAVLADAPISKENIFLYHKTTNRRIYSDRKDRFPNVYDVLLWNEEGELTEFTTGNVVVEIEGEYLTPFVESGLLAGTFRKHLLEQKQIREEKLKLEDLKACSAIWLINSVRQWVRVNLLME
ncbi:aminodeoxychorismate synthase component I [Robertmurraya andreesenii]|uniref:Para-aminobenzoate synthetase/4-amino-4-deoxychorismate lyase n=1 Tax=Anoxybacillus andreesenii TaxID=1325932 RepID=A0ABT9V486_9BACL|nr:aminodeoxychorismate synthase component I [Robertmurraya andreesenii]MDQ0155758.1 para-aminobenzoate synthetase/4-amino-4-deoxychorismate lyase [Robertmurraya andreesenii]